VDEARVVRDDPVDDPMDNPIWDAFARQAYETGVVPDDPVDEPMPISTPYLDRLCERTMRKSVALGPGVRLTYRGDATYAVQTNVRRDAGRNLRACLRAIGVLAGEDDHLAEWSEMIAREDYERRIGPRGTGDGDGILNVELYRSY
jgi:hypothetical protein